MGRLGPLDRIGALPADTAKALRMIPDIAENTKAMEEHTALLADVAAKLKVLDTMDARIAAIEEAMPVLVEVQRHLSQLPETIERLNGLMEKILVALDGLDQSVGTLQGAVEPMGRLASRVPGQRKSERQ